MFVVVFVYNCEVVVIVGLLLLLLFVVVCLVLNLMSVILT